MSPRGSSGCNQRSRPGSYGKKVGEGSLRRFQGAGGLSPDVKGVKGTEQLYNFNVWHNHTREVTAAGAAAVTACASPAALTPVGSCSQGHQKVGSETSRAGAVNIVSTSNVPSLHLAV